MLTGACNNHTKMCMSMETELPAIRSHFWALVPDISNSTVETCKNSLSRKHDVTEKCSVCFLPPGILAFFGQGVFQHRESTNTYSYR